MLFPFHDDTPTERFPIVTVAIIGINVAAFVYTLTLSPVDYRIFIAHHGFVPARLKQLTNPNLNIDVPVGTRTVQVRRGPFIQQGQVQVTESLPPDRRAVLRSLITSLFLHGGIDHIVGNMWFFWLFGNNIEDRLGRIRFVAFYLFAGVFASMCHSAVSALPPGVNMRVPVIGASGAVAAVLGAYAVLYPHARVRALVFLVIFFTVVELPALVVLGIWFFGQLVQAVGMLQNLNLSGGVALWAHVGGFVLGALVIRLIARPPQARVIEATLVDEHQPRQDPSWW